MATNPNSILSQYKDILNSRESPPPFDGKDKPTPNVDTADQADLAKKQHDNDNQPVKEEIAPVKLKRRANATIQQINPFHDRNLVFNIELPAGADTDDQCIILDFGVELHKLANTEAAGQPENFVAAVKAKTVKYQPHTKKYTPSPAKLHNKVIIDTGDQSEDDVGDYDFNDPFIDDEEDLIMEQLLYKPEVEGYFAWKGPVPTRQVTEDELLMDYMDVEQPVVEPVPEPEPAPAVVADQPAKVKTPKKKKAPAEPQTATEGGVPTPKKKRRKKNPEEKAADDLKKELARQKKAAAASTTAAATTSNNAAAVSDQKLKEAKETEAKQVEASM